MLNQANGASAPSAAQASGGGATMQVNPSEVAAHLHVFLQRVQFCAAERQAFDQCELVLQALRSGQLVLTQPKVEPLPDVTRLDG